MRYNGIATVWHKTSEGYTSAQYPCWWQDIEAVNINKAGLTNADTALVHLPLEAVIEKNDYIKRGQFTEEYSSSSELLKAYKPLKVTTVSRKAYGSEHMRHTEITAK